MIIDKLMSTHDGVALSGLSVGNNTLKALELGAARNNGLFVNSNQPGWVVTIKGGTSGGAATIALAVLTDDNSAMSSPTTLYTSATRNQSRPSLVPCRRGPSSPVPMEE